MMTKMETTTKSLVKTMKTSMLLGFLEERGRSKGTAKTAM